MKTFDNSHIKNAISGVCDKLNIGVPYNLLREYQDGLLPDLLSYGKLEVSSLNLPVIQRYLIGASAYLNQPAQYFDIYRACRHTIFIQKLDSALTHLNTKAVNIKERIDRLCKASDYDSFDSILFELVVASNYCRMANTKEVSFIQEDISKSPDFKVSTDKCTYFVECKKYDRSSDISIILRNEIRLKMLPLTKSLSNNNVSAVFNVDFHVDPRTITTERIMDACQKAIKRSSLVSLKELSFSAKMLKPAQLEEFTLFPSPRYYWERYQFRQNSEWHGLFNPINAQYAKIPDSSGMINDGLSTWLNKVAWECAIKWKISDKELLWKTKKLSFNRLFKGLDQLSSKGSNTILHAWLESEQSMVNRKDELLQFYKQLIKNSRDYFAWIIFNETLLDVTPNGIFDIIEHAHIIDGDSSTSDGPYVSTVFTQSDYPNNERAEFGIGYELPKLD